MRVPNPDDCIVAIFGVDSSGGIRAFLGTGTFVTSKPWLLTADHVVRDWKLQFRIASMREPKKTWEARVVRRAPEVDLALLEVTDYLPEVPIELAQEEDIRFNFLVVSTEYGTTRYEGSTIILSPATRVGNVTRLVTLTSLYGTAGESMLELSFPALRGASGAPVLSNENFALWGIIVANAAYHLLPAQIESVIQAEKKIKEDTHFMLPQAVAVNVKHVRHLIEAQ